METKRLLNLEAFSVVSYNVDGTAIPIGIAYTVDGNIKYTSFDENGPERVFYTVVNSFAVNTVYYAHGLVFHFLLFLKPLIKSQIKFRWFFIKYDLYEVIIETQRGRITLRCSHKLIPFKMESFYPSLCDTPKLTKEPLTNDINLSYNSQVYPTLDQESYMKAYASNECYILRCGLINFFSELTCLGIDYSTRPLTCGSIAMKYFTKKYNSIRLSLPKQISSIIRNAYYGGRCEVFGNPRRGEKILHFDFKGMYQSCLKEDLPYGDYFYTSSDLNLNVPGFYYVSLHCRDKIPLLPSRGDKLYFKSGVIRGWYWHEEIIAALDLSSATDVKLEHGLISKRNGRFLSEFIDDLGRLRDQGGLKKQIGKLLINSFYGRLGLDEGIELLQLKADPGDSKKYGQIEDYYLIKKKALFKVQSNVGVAAAVTSKARIKLYEAFLEVNAAGGRVIYCDTDSVFACFPEGANVEDRALGRHVKFDTSLPDTVLKDAVFINPKTYGVLCSNGDEFVKIKGINVDMISFTQLKSSFYSGSSRLPMSSETKRKKGLNLRQMSEDRSIDLKGYDKRI